MIIKYTLNDNDFTQIIEKYLEDFGPFYAFNYTDMRDLDKFKRFVRLYQDYSDVVVDENTLSEQQYKDLKKKLLKILKENFKTYINNIKSNSRWHTDGIDAEHLQEVKDYVLNNIEIKIVKSITDTWQNGEVVYFITSNQKYITF